MDGRIRVVPRDIIPSLSGTGFFVSRRMCKGTGMIMNKLGKEE